MAKPRSLILPLSVDRALKGHSCQHSKKHAIAKGEFPLEDIGRTHSSSTTV